MIFSKREVTVAYTVEKCNSCSNQNKRKFREGDTLFSRIGSCGCGGEFRIEMIYGETFRQ